MSGINYEETISKLEQQCFPESFWSEKAVEETLSRSDVLYGMEYGKNKAPAGYFIGAAAHGEAELYRIAVLPEYRRKGMGKHLLEAFFDSCPKNTSKIFLEVRSKNVAAMELYKRYGFRVIHVRKGYYKDDDGVVMQCTVDSV